MRARPDGEHLLLEDLPARDEGGGRGVLLLGGLRAQARTIELTLLDEGDNHLASEILYGTRSVHEEVQTLQARFAVAALPPTAKVVARTDRGQTLDWTEILADDPVLSWHDDTDS